MPQPAHCHPTAIACVLASLLGASLFVLSACGGGGVEQAVQDAANASTTPDTPATPDPAAGPAGAAQTLQSHLSACPAALAINQDVTCMVGLYEGKTIDTGAYCAFMYDSKGVADYVTGSQSEHVSLHVLYSGAVFEKKAASNAAAFSITWALGIASGHAIDLRYQHPDEPASANGLVIKPKDKTSMPACLVTEAPTVASTGSASTANQLGRTWQSPRMLNGANGAVGYFSDQPGFDAGMADDGRAFITLRQPDASGRMSVQVVEGRPGAAGQDATWTAPQVLDADAPLLTGNYRPRIAVSSTGHAVVSWLTERPCEADAYESSPAGKNCRYLYASRRLASEATWEPARRVRASPPSSAQDHFARINANGDIVLAFSGFGNLSSGNFHDPRPTLAVRAASESAYKYARLSGLWASTQSNDLFSEYVSADLDDAGNLFAAGKSVSPFDVTNTRTTIAAAPDVLASQNHVSGSRTYELKTSGNGFAAYTWADSSGSKLKPSKLTVYSPTSQQWLAGYDINAYTLWGDTSLVGTDKGTGEFLLYSGCKMTAWAAGTWAATRNLPADCGRDQSGGVYAFNRKGDYLGINWAGRAGQWGYYSYTQDKLLKGSPGTGATVGGDFVLGTPSPVFGTAPTQLLLAPNGLALAVTSNTFTTLPSSADPAGVQGASAHKLWAVYLK